MDLDIDVRATGTEVSMLIARSKQGVGDSDVGIRMNIAAACALANALNVAIGNAWQAVPLDRRWDWPLDERRAEVVETQGA